MTVKTMGALILLLAIGILAYGLITRARNPMKVIGTGTVEVRDRSSGNKLILKTRDIEAGAVKTTEVELPNGTWIDCESDCRAAVRRHHLEFWDQPERKG